MDETFLQQIIGCPMEEARHYLNIFDGDAERAVTAVLENRDDKSWWGHPWNARKDNSLEEVTSFGGENMVSNICHLNHLMCLLTYISLTLPQNVASSGRDVSAEEDRSSNDEGNSIPESHCNYGFGEARLQNYNENLTNSATKQSNTKHVSSYLQLHATRFEGTLSAEDISNDRYFYEQYHHLVNNFVDAVCGVDTNKKDLRELISNADNIVSRDTNSNVLLSDLVNRPSFKDNTDEGRTPLSYAVAKNLTKQLAHLIDLGADVSKTMKGATMTNTALTIAAMNQKRDGTEMVRVLLSKGANADELAEAKIDEHLLGLGMRYWLDKSRRVGVPNQAKLAHMKKTPPMDRLHELDYAVVGEEAAVSVIQEALAGRFGNPQGNRKPLVMLLLGPPGKHCNCHSL